MKDRKFRSLNSSPLFLPLIFLSLVDRAVAEVADHAFAGAATGTGQTAEWRQQNKAIQVILLPTFYCPQKSKDGGPKIQKPELKPLIFAPYFFVVPSPPLSRGQSPLLLGFFPIYEPRTPPGTA